MRLTTWSLLFVLALSGRLPAQDGDKVAVEWRFKKGDSFRYEFTMKNEMDVGGMQIDQFILMGQLFEVTDATEDGKGTVKITYDRIKMKMEGGPMEGDYDSDTDKKPEGFLPTVFAGMKGKSISIQLGKKGDVLKVEGMAKMMDDIVKDLPEEHQAMAGMMKAQMTDDYSKTMFQNSLGFLPKAPVAKGESWDFAGKTMFGGGMDMDLKGKATLKEVRDGKEAVIKQESTVALQGGEEGQEVKSDGEVVWLLEEGRMKSSKFTTKGPMGGPGGEVTMVFEMKLAPRAAPAKAEK